MLELIGFDLINLFKIGLALLLSSLIGLEREQNKKCIGIRDITLVTLGATVFSILALDLVKIASLAQTNYDLGRIIAYTIVGIGFLGSGIIVQNKNRVDGVTTASTLWAMVSVGLLCGTGQYALAVITAGCIFFILKLKYIRVKFTNGGKNAKRKSKIRKTL